MPSFRESICVYGYAFQQDQENTTVYFKSVTVKTINCTKATIKNNYNKPFLLYHKNTCMNLDKRMNERMND